MAQQNDCRFYKFGFCKYKDNCRNMHIHERRDNRSCEIKKTALKDILESAVSRETTKDLNIVNGANMTMMIMRLTA